MTTNDNIRFYTSHFEYEIISHAYVQTIFFWGFVLTETTWNKEWYELGYGSANLDHTWIYSLTNWGYDNIWRFESASPPSDGTRITFYFYTVEKTDFNNR